MYIVNLNMISRKCMYLFANAFNFTIVELVGNLNYDDKARCTAAFHLSLVLIKKIKNKQ